MRDLSHYFSLPLTRYRLLALFTLFAMVGVYVFLEERALTVERWVAVVVLSLFAVCGTQRLLGRWPHAAAFVAFLPMLVNMCMQMLDTALSQDFLVKVISVHVLMSICYSNRLWLRVHLAVWSVALIGTALAIPKPHISPLAVATLIVFMSGLTYLTASGIIRGRQKLGRSELLLAQSQALAKVGGWELSRTDGRIRLTDSAWDVLGVERADRDRYVPTDFFAAAEGYAAFVEMIDEVMVHGGPSECRLRIRKPNGDLIWLQIRAVSQRDQEDSLKVLGVFIDVSDSLEREEKLRDAIEAAEEAGLARTRFLANMSHEIRTPMNGVIGMTSLLLESNLAEQERGYVEVIRASGDSLLNIINEILDFSKFESGQIDLESEYFSIENVVSEVLDIVSTLAESKGLRVFLDAQAFPVDGFVGDVSKLRQVLVNLMSNAIKFTEHGSVTLKFRGDAVPEGITALSISVIDTGIGISAEALPSLFDPFMQEDASIARRYGGTGLGLAISKEIINAMGGELTVASEVGKGSTFGFTIPLQTGAAEAVPQLPISRAQVCILTADPVCGEILARNVRDFGGQPTIYSSPDDLDFNQVIDVLLADLDAVSAFSFASLRAQLPATRLVALARMSRRVPRLEANTALLRMPVRHRELWAAMQAPVEDVDNSMAQTAATPAAPLRILLAEDNSVNQKVAVQMLRKLGYGADVASDGLQALALVRQQDYDVVLMDLQMPEMDGLEATAEIRSMAEIIQPYIVAMTANALTSDRDRCLAAGMDDFVPKPVRIGELQAALMRAIRYRESVNVPGGRGVPAASSLPYPH